MQRRLHFTMIVCISLLLSGVFAFAPSHQVMAAVTGIQGTMDHPTPAQERLSCNNDGCAKTHDTCSEHCVRASVEYSTIVLHAPQTEQHALTRTSCGIAVTPQPVDPFGIHTLQNRTPPAFERLKSVLKRE